jgi:trans-2,3-dihydro-3-hydroxyanthranilate isomerase
MTQPLPTSSPWYGDVDALLACLGVEQAMAPIDVYDNGVRHLYVVLAAEADVAALRPDIGRLAEVVTDAGTTCVAGSSTRWKSRMFAPSLGVAEDPATGSAAGPLAVHLCRHGLVPWGTEIVITQGVEINRPSTLYAVARGNDRGVDAVEVAGDTVIVGRGAFDV